MPTHTPPAAISPAHTPRRLSVEVDRQGVFARLGRVEVYARRDNQGPRSWGIFREPGAVEVDAGSLRVTVSRAPG